MRTAIEKLKKTWEITHYATNEYTTLALNNWESYNTPDNKRITNEQQTNNKRITTTNKNNKEYKEYKEYNIKIISEKINSMEKWTARYNFYSFLLEINDRIEEAIDTEKIDNKFKEFLSKLWEQKAVLELESFCEHHRNEKTVFKSTIGRLNTWLANKLK